MKSRILLIGGGLAALSLALVALPSPSATTQDPEGSSLAKVQQKIEELQARLQQKRGRIMQLAQSRALEASQHALLQQEHALEALEDTPVPDVEEFALSLDAEGAGWLGVEIHEVTPDKAKELKLPAERGVILGKIISDSPAAKAGLKENDVVTEVNGQRIEGTAQFRRMIHEIPAGRAVQLTIWRDGRAQTISVTLGKAEQHYHAWAHAAPHGSFAFRIPEMPEVPDVSEMPEWDGMMMPSPHPRLGIDAEDLSGQLGAYFGAPEGEGVLVRDVNPGSSAEKAGLKAGDVITAFNGERIRSVGDLREKLAGKRDEKSVKLGVIRNKSEISLTAELPAPAPKAPHRSAHGTHI
jgi:C-terminal processing protease CtpA/Prc